MLAFVLAAAPAVADPLGIAPPAKCASADPKDVVVCGSRGQSQRYRIPKLTDQYKSHAIRAATTIAGMPARAHVDEVDLPGGLKGKRLLLTMSTAF